MKKFSLQAVLDYRKRQEDIALHRLAEAKNHLLLVEKKREQEQKTLTDLIEDAERQQRIGIEITKLIRYEERIEGQRLSVRQIEKNLEDKRRLVEQETKNLIQRSQEHQIMERVKETQEKAWTAYLNKKEAAMLDEIATSRYQST